ncbi:MAG: ImmA/IrrE family metallo-endopeptidase [Bryobacteraceae bacterium]|jgi:hypothetical protein
MTREKIPWGIVQRFQQTPPVNVSGLARALGLRVWLSRKLPDGISGVLKRDKKNGGESGYSIIVRKSDSFERQRFTVAHEISHFLLHRDSIGMELADNALYRSGLSTLKEAEANRLAAEILMPRNLIDWCVPRCGSSDPKALASALKVSEAAMKIRLGIS